MERQGREMEGMEEEWKLGRRNVGREEKWKAG